MKSKDKKPEPFARLLQRESLLLVALQVLLILVFLLLWFLLDSYDSTTDRIRHFAGEDALLYQEKYESIDTGRQGDWFEILTEDGSVVYTSDGGETKSSAYAPDYLTYIPSDTDLTGEEKTNWLILPFSGEETTDYAVCLIEGTDQEWLTKEILFLDADRNVLYQRGGTDTVSTLSEDALAAITESGDGVLAKHAFYTSSGELRYLVMHLEGNLMRDESVRENLRIVLVLGFAALSFLLIFFHGRRLSKRVSVPAKSLEHAMECYSRGETVEMDPGNGPAEITQVMDTFKRMQDEIEEKKKQNEALQEEKRRMLADLSHDLLTPVAVIEGYTEALRDHVVPEGEQDAYLEIIDKRTKTLAELIDTFGTYAKLDHPDFQLQKEKTAFPVWLREYFAERYTELQVAGYPLSADIPYEEMDVDLDEKQFRRVLENILTNAQRHTAPGTPLYVSLKREEQEAVLLVGDGGEGIPAALGEKIFEPFVKADEARSGGKGSGLGLSIARRIVEMHGGTIHLAGEQEMQELSKTFDENITHGTLFVIRLPICTT